MKTNTILIGALAALLAMSPGAFAIGSAAQPFPHEYYGTAVNNAVAHVDYSGPLGTLQGDFTSDLTVEGTCTDVSPLLGPSITPPTIVRDGIAEMALGSACFTFQTIYGDDTGTTQTIALQNQELNFAPVFAVCVDVNGDGICQTGVDQTNLCWTGPSGAGSESLVTSGACTIYLDPLATLNPAVYVNVLTVINVTNGNPVQSASLHGFVYYQ